MMGYSDHSKQPSLSIKDKVLRDQLRDSQLLKKNSLPWGIGLTCQTRY